jgi:phosphatidylserine/phosphatidylglycerophosphate/cardiolipin synthase-like enzyme
VRPAVLALILAGVALPASAQERLCDPALEDCRAPLLQLIRDETAGIDVGFWEMNDGRYAAALIKRFRAGVPVRILMDAEAITIKPKTAPIMAQLVAAGIPMRQKVSKGILHWKMMLFHGQNVVEFSKANYSPYSFVASVPGQSWIDEAVYFTDDSRLTDTFRTAFDNRWINTASYGSYANIHGPLVRQYPRLPMAPEMNFAPQEDFGARLLPRLRAEPTQIDVIMFRLLDVRLVDAAIAAVQRGVQVRVITEPDSYSDRKRPAHRENVDRLSAAGVQIKHRAHRGQTHEGLTILRGLGEVVFGSANWSTGPSAEYNLFYHPGLGKPWFYQWFVDQFERKWNNEAAFVPFMPQR